MNSIITTKDVKKVFRTGGGDFYALKNVNIEIPRGKLTILKGRSGSGKTTLLNILSTLDMPTEGEVFFNERPYSKMSESNKEFLRRNMIGFIFQSVALVPIMNAYENIDFSLRLAECKENHDEKIKSAARLVGMEDRLLHMPGQMSGGEQQRIAIARAVVQEPEIVFADEPTGALDTESGIRVMRLFQKLVETKNITIVMTTHDSNLMEMGDVVYEMEDGELIDRHER